MRIFLRAGLDLEDERLRREAIAMRYAQHAEADDFKDFIRGD